MKNFFITSLLLLVFINSALSKQLRVYYCKNYIDAESCTNCSPDLSGWKIPAKSVQSVEFEINEKKKMVLQKTFFDGKFHSSDILENCKIFDKNNWDCTDSFYVSSGPWYMYTVNKMTNETWTWGTYTSKETKFNATNGSCAK